MVRRLLNAGEDYDADLIPTPETDSDYWYYYEDDTIEDIKARAEYEDTEASNAGTYRESNLAKLIAAASCYDASAGDDGAWPHILYKVPDAAVIGQRYYGKI